jgi:hypothetical protein
MVGSRETDEIEGVGRFEAVEGVSGSAIVTMHNVSTIQSSQNI